jgi:signal recognition particle subunit SRP54
MGNLADMMGDGDVEGEFRQLTGIIDSMTPEERRNPTKVIDQSRRRRIAAGAGVEPHQVNELVKMFEPMSGLLRDMAGKGVRDRMKTMQQLTQSGLLNPGAKLAKMKKGTGKRLTPQEKAQARKMRERELRKRRREEKNKKS